jgi:hypothetical protein
LAVERETKKKPSGAEAAGIVWCLRLIGNAHVRGRIITDFLGARCGD